MSDPKRTHGKSQPQALAHGAAGRACRREAPPVYRPQPVPKVLQRKTAVASPACGAHAQQAAKPAPGPSPRGAHAGPERQRQTPAAPPPYRPQSAPACLQRKTPPGAQSPTGSAGLTGSGAQRRSPTTQPKATKALATGVERHAAASPAPHARAGRPNAPGVVQRTKARGLERAAAPHGALPKVVPPGAQRPIFPAKQAAVQPYGLKSAAGRPAAAAPLPGRVSPPGRGGVVQRAATSSTSAVDPPVHSKDLSDLSKDAKNFAKQKNKKAKVEEVQAMHIGSNVVLSSNYPGELLAVIDDIEKDAGEFTSAAMTSMGVTTSVICAEAGVAAGKLGGSNKLVILKGVGIHAEQNLLMVLAHLLSNGQRPGDVEIYGIKNPCVSCATVLAAFKDSYRHVYHASIKYSLLPGEKRAGSDIEKLDLKVEFGSNRAGDFGNFINRYHTHIPSSRDVVVRPAPTTTTTTTTTTSASTSSSSSPPPVKKSTPAPPTGKGKAPVSQQTHATAPTPTATTTTATTQDTQAQGGRSWRFYAAATMVGLTAITAAAMFGLEYYRQQTDPTKS